ncbi:MAG: class I SAM-dependent methyltransferase [Gammaproteobacteria bacterium]|nr:class I SAM-dependent methyltransferase [Gammaproteobacteria bacterium]
MSPTPSRTLTLLLALVLLGAFGSSWAEQERSVNPGINASYADSQWQRWVDIFERDGREVYDRRHDILEALAIERGSTVADIGAGTGFFTRLFAREVGPEGRVYAVDITPTFVDNVVRRAQEQGHDNVTGIINTPRDVLLPEAAVDLAFISDTYHHFEYPISTMRSLHRALKPGSEVVVIDFKRIPGVSNPWVLGHVRAGKEVFIREIESAGFVLEEERGFMETQYFLRFRKDSESGASSTLKGRMVNRE